MPKKKTTNDKKNKDKLDKASNKFYDAMHGDSDEEIYEGGLNNNLSDADSDIIESGSETYNEDTFMTGGKDNNDDDVDDDNENDLEDEIDEDIENIDEGSGDEEEELYKQAQKTDIYSDDEDDYEEILDEDTNLIKQNSVLKGDNRITKPILTKYERVRILGERTKHISLGAKPMIKNTAGLSSRDIAKLELKHNVIPIIIVRPLPNGLVEEWKISELIH